MSLFQAFYPHLPLRHLLFHSLRFDVADNPHVNDFLQCPHPLQWNFNPYEKNPDLVDGPMESIKGILYAIIGRTIILLFQLSNMLLTGTYRHNRTYNKKSEAPYEVYRLETWEEQFHKLRDKFMWRRNLMI